MFKTSKFWWRKCIEVQVNGRCWSSLTSQLKSNETVEPVMMAYTSYEETGSESSEKTPLLIMHGLFGSKTNWNSLCKAYQRSLNCKVYAVDARNHGDSPHSAKHSYVHLAEDVRHFLDQFRIRKCKVLGHSMGGRALMYFALKYPEMVDRLIVVDISPIGTSQSLNSMPPLFEYMAKVQMPRSGTVAEARALIDKQLTMKITDRPLRSFLLTNVVQRNDGSFAWRINLHSLLVNFRDNIANFPPTGEAIYNGPTLFIGGGLSDYIPNSHKSGIKKMFPKAELMYIPEAGHWVHSQKPNEFMQISTEFLRRDQQQQQQQT